jgi:hypothetical protein
VSGGNNGKTWRKVHQPKLVSALKNHRGKNVAKITCLARHHEIKAMSPFFACFNPGKISPANISTLCIF